MRRSSPPPVGPVAREKLWSVYHVSEAGEPRAVNGRLPAGGADDLPTFRVVLRCPTCGHQWLAAILDPDAWWGRGVTAETIARQCYCRSCTTPPPMQIVIVSPQLSLFD